MYHMRLELLDADEDIELIVRKINFEVATLQVRIIRHYTSERIGSNKWYVIFRNVTADNWERVCATVSKALRNYNCRFAIKHPTIRNRSFTRGME